MKNFQTISGIIFVPFTVFPCKVNSPQVKRSLKSTITNFVYEVPRELRNSLRIRIFGNQERKRKSQNQWRHRLVSILPSKNQFLAIAVKTYAKANIKVFWSFPILLEFFTFGKSFLSLIVGLLEMIFFEKKDQILLLRKYR